MRYFGANISFSNNAKDSLALSTECKINAVQIMPSAPIRWISKDIPDTAAIEFVKNQKEGSVKKVLLHCIYLINLARSDKQMFHMSKLSLVSYLNFADALTRAANESGSDLEVIGVTFHPGSAKDLTPEEGIKRISEGLDWIVENSKGSEYLLLESSAGAGNIMGDTLEELHEMRIGSKYPERVGYVLDTQHMFVSGYDWINDLDGVVGKIDSVLGLSNVRCFHLNDSLMEFNCHKDRHANLGQGKIGLEAIKKIINHPQLSNIPFILETPGLGQTDSFKKECEILTSLVV